MPTFAEPAYSSPPNCQVEMPIHVHSMNVCRDHPVMIAGETLAVVGKKIIPAATGESSTLDADDDRALMGGVDLRRPQI
jgi:hypothetical protein